MNRLEREVISRIAMIVMAAILVLAGAAVIWLPWFVSDDRVLTFGIGLIVAGLYLFIMSFRRSVNTDREPSDPRYRIK